MSSSQSVATHQLSESVVDEVAYLVNTRGFATVPDFLSAAECQALKDKYVPLLMNYAPSGSSRAYIDKQHIHDLLAKDVTFAKLLDDPRLQQLLAPLLGPNWIMYAFTTSSVPPQGTNYGSRIHVDSPRLIPGYPTNVGVIWALDDFTDENGGTELLPGSHHSQVVPTESTFAANRTKLTCKAGSLVVFHARVFHRAGSNQTDVWRHALTMNVCRPFMKQRMDWVRLVPKSIADQLTPQGRRILGYDTRLPTSLDEFFVPEEQRLYKANQE